ncbi:MAG: bestrophin family ion channel [Verrucomicrobiota bacterium]
MILDSKIAFRYILNKAKYDLAVVLFVGLGVNILTIKFNQHLPELPLAIPTFLGTAISILLSFKMNQSYDRWWEARKVWGAIVNDSRTLVLQLQSFLGGSPLVERLAHRQIFWALALGKSLRGLNPLQDTQGLISDNEKEEVAQHSNKPLALLQKTAQEISQARRNGEIDTLTHLQFDNTLTRLCDAMGRAERINGTVFPSTYRHFLHYIIYIFVVTFSISLRNVNMVLEVPLILAISAAFFLIEKSAYHLQDPFRNRPSDVSVSAIARTIEINIRQLLGERNVPEPVKPIDFYIL